MTWHQIGVRQQAIIWTNADRIHWCIYMYVALGGGELTSNDTIKSIKSFIAMDFFQMISFQWILKEF